MTKTEYIAKYGEEAYEYRLKHYRERYSRKTPSRTDCEVRIWRPAPEVEEEGRPQCIISDERCRMIDEIVRQYQKQIRSIWKTYTKDDCIITVDYGQVRGGKVPYTFQITDLHLTEEKKNRFFEAVNEVIKELAENQ